MRFALWQEHWLQPRQAIRHAINTGKIQAGEAKLSGLRKELEKIFNMDVDISIIEVGGPFDNPPFIPFE